MTPFEESLFETLFPNFIAFTNDYVATYVLHMPGREPVFFKKLSELEIQTSQVDDIVVYAVKTDGSVENVTRVWKKVFEKQRTAQTAIENLVKKWDDMVPIDVATYELKHDSTTLGYFPRPSVSILRQVDRVRDTRRLTVLAIHKTGEIEDVTKHWKPMFDEYISLRMKNHK